MDNTTELKLGEKTYTLRLRLGWREQAKIDQAGMRLFADGAAIAESNDIGSIKEVEIRPDIEHQNYLRLELRLVGLKRREVDDINPAHVPFLIEAIEKLEAETRAEINSLRDSLNPTNPIE